VVATVGTTWQASGSGGNNQNFAGFEILNATGGSGNDSFAVSGAVAATLDGGAGNDTITAGTGSDTITGGSGADILTGGAGADTFVFRDLTNSPVTGFDTIADFVSGTDHFSIGHVLSGTVTDFSMSGSAGTLADDLNAVLNSANLLANGAAEITINGSSHAGTYLIINDGNAGYVSASDSVIKLLNAVHVQASDFIV
jgi:large repetitive protein